MKKLILIALVALVSCDPVGQTETKLIGSEVNLPAELKGLKIYSVCVGVGDYVKIGVMNSNIISTTYSKGKMRDSLIMVNCQNRLIETTSIIYENDSIIVLRK